MTDDLYKDRVKEFCIGPHTGPYVGQGAPNTCVRFRDSYQAGDQPHVVAVQRGGAKWEVGRVTYLGNDTIDRNSSEVLMGSNGPGALVDFDDGVIVDFWVDIPGRVIDRLARSYRYVQSTPAAIWTINHTMHKYPSVIAVDSAGTIVIPKVEYLSEDSVRLTFATGPFSGKAYLN
jgi:hypothetical protein